MNTSRSQWPRGITLILAGAALVAVGALADGLLLGAQTRPEVEAPVSAALEDEGHVDDSPTDERGDEDPANTVDLSPAALKSIGLTTEVVRPRPVESTLSFPGSVRMHPDGIAILSTRIQGKVVTASAAPGDRVRQGQVLARVQSLVPGNPPPIVELTAPISGVVARRDATVGEAVQPDKELFRLIDPRRVVAEARVPERLVDRVRPQQEARFRRLRDTRWWSGRVSFVGSEVDPATRTYAVWVTLDADGPPPPRPGQYGEILLVESRRTALTVPADAVVEEGPLRFVFVQGEHGFEQRLVQTGAEDSQNLEIVSGIDPGETVAVTGSLELLLAAQSGGLGAADPESVPHGH